LEDLHNPSPKTAKLQTTMMSLNRARASIMLALLLLGVAVTGLVTPQTTFSSASLSTRTGRSTSSSPGLLQAADASSVASDIPRGGAGGGASAEAGTATIPNEVFNLVKSIVGAGVLSLPAGENEEKRKRE
jgi:hypothetical protein